MNEEIIKYIPITALCIKSSILSLSLQKKKFEELSKVYDLLSDDNFAKFRQKVEFWAWMDYPNNKRNMFNS